MKRILIITALVLLAASAWAPPAATKGSLYRRAVIPAAGVVASIQPLKQHSDGSWPEPNHVNAWVLASYPQAIYMHRGTLGSKFHLLEEGDLLYLYEDWIFEDEPLQLRVFDLEIIPEEEEPTVWGEVEDSDVFALITCHPANDPVAPERLVVWAKVDRGPRWVYVNWGDCLSGIAQRYSVSVEAIVEANGIEDPNFIQVGSWLKIPTTN